MKYQPGVCNIGPAQQRRRLLLGVGSLLLGIVHVAASSPSAGRSGRFSSRRSRCPAPLSGAAVGYFQYRERFCVGFAGMGVFDDGDGTTRITDEDALSADRKRAVRLNTKSLAAGALGALAIYGVAIAAL